MSLGSTRGLRVVCGALAENFCVPVAAGQFDEAPNCAREGACALQKLDIAG
jgi:hypothetical protein